MLSGKLRSHGDWVGGTNSRDSASRSTMGLFVGGEPMDGEITTGGDDETKSITRARCREVLLPPWTILDSIRSSLVSRSWSPSRIADNSWRTGDPFGKAGLASSPRDLGLPASSTRRATRSAIDLA